MSEQENKISIEKYVLLNMALINNQFCSITTNPLNSYDEYGEVFASIPPYFYTGYIVKMYEEGFIMLCIYPVENGTTNHSLKNFSYDDIYSINTPYILKEKEKIIINNYIETLNNFSDMNVEFDKNIALPCIEFYRNEIEKTLDLAISETQSKLKKTNKKHINKKDIKKD